jgi:hypothetical protein
MNLPPSLVVQVTASTPLRAHFDDSDRRKNEPNIYESPIGGDDEKANSDSSNASKLQRLRTFFRHNSRHNNQPICSEC